MRNSCQHADEPIRPLSIDQKNMFSHVAAKLDLRQHSLIAGIDCIGSLISFSLARQRNQSAFHLHLVFRVFLLENHDVLFAFHGVCARCSSRPE